MPAAAIKLGEAPVGALIVLHDDEEEDDADDDAE
jgi:hypothetical protein